MCQVLDSARIEYLKWDFNRSISDIYSAVLPSDKQGEVAHRFILGLYDMLDKLGRRYPNMLIDVPMARCYVNSYMNHPEAIHAVIEKLMGKSEFKGKYNDNVFCERWETRF